MNKKIVPLLALLLVSSCSTPSTNNKGFVKIDFKFPQTKSFNIKAIPENTQSFEVSIKGEGLSEAIVKKIDKENSDKVFFQEIPVGEKDISVSAFGNSNKLLAKAETKIDIKAGQVNKATLELATILKNFKINLTDYPSDSSVYAEITIKNKVTQEELKSSTIELKDLEADSVKVRVIAFNQESTPILSAEKVIDVSKTDSDNIKLEKILLPKKFDFNLNDWSKDKVLDTFNKNIIIFKDNKRPYINKLTVLVNNKEIIPPASSTSPYCLSTSDSLKIDINIDDDDNDKINLFWLKNTLLGSQYLLNLQTERGLSFSSSGSELGTGNHSLSFIATDRKSVVGPIPLFFRVDENRCQ